MHASDYACIRMFSVPSLTLVMGLSAPFRLVEHAVFSRWCRLVSCPWRSCGARLQQPHSQHGKKSRMHMWTDPLFVAVLFCPNLALASLQSTGTQRIGSQEQVQHQNAKSTKYKDQQLAYCAQREQQCDQRPLYVSPHRGPQPLATPDGLQPLPGG